MEFLYQDTLVGRFRRYGILGIGFMHIMFMPALIANPDSNIN